MTNERGSRKPSQDEHDYFKQRDREKMHKAAAERSDRAVAEAADALREAHWMRCAKCGNVMETVAFRGVEIERCPGCGGVYLDRGELEQLAGEDRSGVFSHLAEMLGMKGG